MEYSNPEVPHEVNVTPAHKEWRILRYFIYLILGIFVIFFILRAFLPYIPFEYEQRFSDAIQEHYPRSQKYQEAETYLLSLANNLSTSMEMPSHYKLNLIVIDDKEQNAFATLGGNIIITTGLIKTIDSENGLAMVLGHEIGHIKNRDPIRATGSRLFIYAALSILGGISETNAISSIAGFTDNTFSRKQENDADRLALTALQKHYGHTLGAEEFFKKIDNLPFVIEFMSTHPVTKDRLNAIYQTQNHSQGKLTPLPPSLMKIKKNL